MEILGNMEGQWGPPSYHSNVTPVCRESQRNGKLGKKGKYAFKVASGFEENTNQPEASEYQDRWEPCKKEPKSKTNGSFANI